MASRRASTHTAPQAGAGCSQLRNSAGHVSAIRSRPQPGRSDQAAATQRAFGRSIVGADAGEAGAGAVDAAVAAGPPVLRPGVPGGGVACAGPGGTIGGLEQAAVSASVVPRMALAARPLAFRKAHVMWVILLEALGALLLLVFIVWWTMFAGRRRGEREDGDGRP